MAFSDARNLRPKANPLPTTLDICMVMEHIGTLDPRNFGHNMGRYYGVPRHTYMRNSFWIVKHNMTPWINFEPKGTLGIKNEKILWLSDIKPLEPKKLQLQHVLVLSLIHI